jgi:hypothetical protein
MSYAATTVRRHFDLSPAKAPYDTLLSLGHRSEEVLVKKSAAALLPFLCLLLQAADPTGSIGGRVVDPSGAAVVNAKVIATAIATGLTREVATAGDGGYIFPLLPPGIYSLAVDAGGFSRFEQRGIEVRANVSSTVPIALQVGSATQSVTVEANAELVDTRSGTLREVVDERRIMDLPLQGRNAATLVLLAPGTVDLQTANARGKGDAAQSSSYPGIQAISANGARGDGINYQLDGGSNLDHYTNVNNPFPNPDALQEFSVQTNNYSAEYGRTYGAVVNIVTKSGSNQLHGSLFEYMRNGALNARNFFAPVGDKLKRNQFGGAVGGRIIKDKLFFFGTYQGMRLANVAGGLTAFVPTAAQRAGDFSAISQQLVDPISHQPFPRNQIPTSRLDPVATKLLPLIPLPNGANGFLVFDRLDHEHENQFMGRVDYNLRSHRLYGRYFYARYPVEAVTQDLIRAFRGTLFFNQAASVSDTYTISPSLFNSAIFSFSQTDGTVSSSAPFGMADIGSNVAQSSPPGIFIPVTGYFSINTGEPGTFKRKTFHFSDSAHWVRGTHEIAFGGDIMDNWTDLENTFLQNPRYQFQGTTFSGNPLADFMLGAVQRLQTGGGQYVARRGLLKALFLQDNIRATHSLTLSLGVRWEPYTPDSDELGRTECYVPGRQSQRFINSPPGYLFAGDAGCPDGGSQSQWKQFAPRFGFAYDLGGKGRTTIRGGWGMFYQPPFAESRIAMSNTAPFSPQYFLFGVSMDNPWAGQTNPFPAQFAPKIPEKDAAFQLPIIGISFAPDWRPARVMGWNLTIEHQLANNLLARVGYIGTKGTHLPYNVDLNHAIYSPGATVADTQQRRPNQNFQTLIQDISGGNSNYNSLQLSLERRFAQGFSISASYTFSRSIDYNSAAAALININLINTDNARAYRGVSDFNIPHHLVVNYVWQLPSPKRSTWLRLIAGGWQTNAIWNWQSGFPLTFLSGEDRSRTGIGNDSADVISKPGYTSGSRGQRIAQWFTTSSFVPAALGTFGNAGRNILLGPGLFNVNFSALKNFMITERWRLQYRAEFFNFFNNTPLGNPGATLGSPSFGRITSAGDPRILQMALKLYF